MNPKQAHESALEAEKTRRIYRFTTKWIAGRTPPETTVETLQTAQPPTVKKP